MDTTCRGCGKKGHYEKVCLQGKHSAHSLETPQTTSAGAGASEPLYFNKEGQPVYTYMVSVPHANKHLIRFPITIEPMTLRRKGTDVDSSLSTPSVLLKADTGADINLINRKTFNQLFDSKVLKPTPIRMENYGNSAVKVLGMFHAFLRWKERVYKQLFYLTDCDRSPELVVKGCLLHSGCSQTLLHSGEGTKYATTFGTKTLASSNDERRETVLTIPGNSQFHRVS